MKGVQNFCFWQLRMQILWRRRCSCVVDLKLPNVSLDFVSGNIRTLGRFCLNTLLISPLCSISFYMTPYDADITCKLLHLCPGSILLAKICLQIIFAIVATEIIAETIMTNSVTNIAKIARVTNVTKFKA